ncbi:PREDICTED: myb-related transcription factor, partner of profilin-like [Nanorana parkeri]|uniref:myb-related transcription factor, partner of profilin-like n=1 Tax=Nanorana parkeri TaxID=125878 RepID=UPI0008542B07|nr:PREDICTED: myb-related transcription factor, partner of profilin-like [Nanorana parkeri]
MATHQQPSTWVRRRKGAGSRKKNLTFSFVENIALIHAVVPFWADLYGERAPYHTFVEKAAMWEQVAAAVNSISRQIRTAQHCRKRVSVIKRQIRFKYIQHRDAIERAEGGEAPRPLVLLPYEKEMMSVIGEELITGLGGDLDTDRPVQLPTEERGVADTFSSAAQSGDILTPGHEEIEALDLAPAQILGEASSSSPSGEGLMDLSQAPSSLEPQDVTPPIPELPSQAVPVFSPNYDGEDASISSPAPSTQTPPHQLEGASLLQCCMDTQAQLIQEHRRARRSLNLLYREQRRHHLVAERENHRNHLRAEQEAIRHHTRMEEEAAGLTCAVRQLVAIFGGGSSQIDPGQLQVTAQLLRAHKSARVTHNRGRPSKGGSSAGVSTSKGQPAE